MAKKKSPARSCKKKKTPEQVASDKLFEGITTTMSEPSVENVAISKALQTLRLYELKKSREIEKEIMTIERNCKDKFLRSVIDEIIQSDNLRIIDIATIANIIAAELTTLPIWEYENKEFVDDVILECLEDDLDTSVKTPSHHAKAMLTAVGGLCVEDIEEGDEEDEE